MSSEPVMDSEGNHLHLTDSNSDESDIECETCEKIFSDAKSYQQHLHTKKHYKMLKKAKLMQRFPDSIDPDEDSLAHSEAKRSSELRCRTCHKSFSGFESYETHVRSSVHAKNVKKQKLTEDMKDSPDVLGNQNGSAEEEGEDVLQRTFARCSTCLKSFSGPESYQQHLQSEAHLKKLKLKKMADDRNIGDGDEFQCRCDTCNKTFSGIAPYEIHMHSAVHKRELLRAEVEKEIEDLCIKDPETKLLVCKECQKPFSDPFALQAHIKNNAHAKHISKKEIFDFVSANPDITAVKSLTSSDEGEVKDGEELSSYPVGSYFMICKLCHISLTGPESARDHVRSKKHLKAAEDKKAMKLLKEQQQTKKNMSNGTAMSPENGTEQQTKKSPENGTVPSVNGDVSAKKPTVASNGKPSNKETTADDDGFELV